MSDGQANPGPLPHGWRLDGAGGELLLVVTGDLDIATVDRLSRVIEDSLERHVEELTVDLSRAGFTDSMGLRLLVATHQRMESRGARLRLRVSRRLHRLLELAGLLALLHVDEIDEG